MMAGAGTPSLEEGPQWGMVSQEMAGDPMGSGGGKAAPLQPCACGQDAGQTPLSPLSHSVPAHRTQRSDACPGRHRSGQSSARGEVLPMAPTVWPAVLPSWATRCLRGQLNLNTVTGERGDHSGVLSPPLDQVGVRNCSATSTSFVSLIRHTGRQGKASGRGWGPQSCPEHQHQSQVCPGGSGLSLS